MTNRPTVSDYYALWVRVTEANQTGFSEILSMHGKYNAGKLNVVNAIPYIVTLIPLIETMDEAIARPGFAAYADSLYDASEYVPSTKFAPGRDQLVAVRDALVAAIPLDEDGNLIGYKPDLATGQIAYDQIVNTALSSAMNAALAWAAT